MASLPEGMHPYKQVVGLVANDKGAHVQFVVTGDGYMYYYYNGNITDIRFPRVVMSYNIKH